MLLTHDAHLVASSRAVHRYTAALNVHHAAEPWYMLIRPSLLTVCTSMQLLAMCVRHAAGQMVPC